MVHRFATEEAFLSQWRQVLDERVRQAVESLAGVEGVVGLILGGSLGGGEPWPLSDIDMLPVYEDASAEQASADVAKRRLALLDRWVAEGFRTPLDVGKIAFVRSEVEEALTAGSGAAVRYLGDLRWFHGLDKAYRGKPVYDPSGLTARLVDWLTAARFQPAVAEARVSRNRRHAEERLQRACALLEGGDGSGAALALHDGAWAVLTCLLEGWGVRDNSFARVGTRFERAAFGRGEVELAERVMAMFHLTPAEVSRRMAAAPERIRDRHRLSLRARRLVGEEVSVEQDARDVLLTLSSQEIRYSTPPFEPWVGIETTPTALRQHLEACARILGDP